MENNNLKRTAFERCPEGLRYPEVRYPVQLEMGKGPCMMSLSEQKAQYCVPAKNPKIVTRESRLEQFWWHEFYEEYLRAIQRSIQPHPMPNSEYTDNYRKEVTSSSTDELIDKFPLYASNGISFYNQTGDKTCNFRKNYAITKPVYLQDEQFG